MRTVQQLKDAGFTVRPASDAVDCTEVLLAAPFWYYNPKFYESMSDIYANLQAANQTEAGHRLLLAGLYADDAVFPFNILDGERKSWLDDARQRFGQHRNDMQRAQDDFFDVLRTDEAYFA